MVAVKGGIKKRLSKSVILIAIAVILLTFAFTACDTTSRELHTVTFLADGVTVKTVNTYGNEIIALPDASEKNGYDFVGWYLDENVWSVPFTADYFADKATTKNVNVYAR